jgi:hypothetical protein
MELLLTWMAEAATIGELRQIEELARRLVWDHESAERAKRFNNE